MANTQLNLVQQFGRFLFVGALAFTVVFWGTSMVLVSSQDSHHYFTVVRVILKSVAHQPFRAWLRDLETGYMPFFFRQPSLMACYLISSSIAWLAAFVYDGRILRKENAA